MSGYTNMKTSTKVMLIGGLAGVLFGFGGGVYSMPETPIEIRKSYQLETILNQKGTVWIQTPEKVSEYMDAIEEYNKLVSSEEFLRLKAEYKSQKRLAGLLFLLGMASAVLLGEGVSKVFIDEAKKREYEV